MKLYRLIEYDGDRPDIDIILARSLRGTYRAARVSLTVAEVKPGGITFEQKAKLNDARKNPMSGWPGQQGIDK